MLNAKLNALVNVVLNVMLNAMLTNLEGRHIGRDTTDENSVRSTVPVVDVDVDAVELKLRHHLGIPYRRCCSLLLLLLLQL